MPGNRTLTVLLDRLTDRASEGDVRVADLVEAISHRAFPLLTLAPALIVITPASAIPGMPTFAGLMIVIVSGIFGAES